MSAKVKQDAKGKFWLVVNHSYRRRVKLFGTRKADREAAEKAAARINGLIAAGEFSWADADEDTPTVKAVLDRWYALHELQFKESHRVTASRDIKKHLVPAFGELPIDQLKRSHVQEFIRAKVEADLGPKTILKVLSTLRAACYWAMEEELIQRNPVAHVGKLIERVARGQSKEARQVDAFTDKEVATLLSLAKTREGTIHRARGDRPDDMSKDTYRKARLRLHERPFYPVLRFAVGTGCRKGEILGLQWTDVDFERSRVTIRRAIVRGRETTPKNGKARTIAIPMSLSAFLRELLAQRRRECLDMGWPEVPKWVFPAAAGGPMEDRNFQRSWDRIRRVAGDKHGVRKLGFHCFRHYYASKALASGRNVLWVAAQLGHSDGRLVLRDYAHVLPEEEVDLSFAEPPAEPTRRPHSAIFGTSHARIGRPRTRRTATVRKPEGFLERETGLEPATLGLGSRCSTN